MRRRVHRPEGAPAGGYRLEVRPLEGASRLVTLEDPSRGAQEARGAFARLRPPEGTPAEAVASWREEVARVALAVRVVPAPRAALVPVASERSDERAAGTIREEATALAAEAADPAVAALVATILDEVGA